MEKIIVMNGYKFIVKTLQGDTLPDEARYRIAAYYLRNMKPRPRKNKVNEIIVNNQILGLLGLR